MTRPASAAAPSEGELTLSVVKPMQSDFHFFVQSVGGSIRAEAEAEVQSSLPSAKVSSPVNDETHRAYLINTNLNARLMKAWEDLKVEERDAYAKKEEEDRKRFMEEDEVASRHCATLTARVKSPGDAGGVAGGGGAGKDSSPGRKKVKEKSQPTKLGTDGDGDGDGDRDPGLDLQASESQDDDDRDGRDPKDEKDAKRSPGESDVDDQSPSKKNRLEEEEI
jgi:hypothetical protein